MPIRIGSQTKLATVGRGQLSHYCVSLHFNTMMTSSNGNVCRVTGYLCGEFTGHRWIPRTKASGALMFSLICALINGWVNNREAGDLRRHRSRNDVTVMTSRLRQNVPRFAVGISKLISLNLYCDWILSSICSKGSNWQQNSVWWQAIIWTNDGLVCWCICASFGLDEFKDVRSPRGAALSGTLLIAKLVMNVVNGLEYVLPGPNLIRQRNHTFLKNSSRDDIMSVNLWIKIWLTHWHPGVTPYGFSELGHRCCCCCCCCCSVCMCV